MNKRALEIVEELGGSDELLTIAGLAEQHGVSQRTIRKDLDAIDDALRRNGQAGLRLERGGRIVCMDDPRFLLGEASAAAAAGEYRLSREERVALAACLIALANEGTTLGAIAETLLVSRTTVINDLDAIKACIADSGLMPVSKASKGLRAEGDERTRRLMLLRVATGLPDAAFRVLMAQTSLLAGNVEVVEKILEEQQRAHGCILTDAGSRTIGTYLCICVARLQGGHVLGERDIPAGTAAESPLMPLSRDLMDLVERYFHVRPTPAETALLCDRLDHQQYTRRTVERDDAPKVQLMTRQLIARISDELGIDLGDDFTFFESLSNHLDSVLQPEPVEYPDTPLIREVIRDNQAIVQAVRACDDIVCSYVGRDLSDLELGYVALHVCAAIERKKRRQAPLHVVVVCNSGVGTSQLLRERLSGSFNFKIVRACTSREARDLAPADADLAISTVQLEGVAIEWMLVNPLLTDEDVRRISAKVNALRSARNLDVDAPRPDEGRNARDLLAQLAPVVYDLAPDRAPALMRAVRRVVSSYFGSRDAGEVRSGQPSVRDLLPPSHIRLDVACRDWREAVRESAQVLLKGGYVESRYVDAMIANIEENGPYVVLTPGFAIPHEGVGCGTNEVGLALVRLERPVAFGEPDFDPVEFVCCLSPVDHSSHMRALFNLVALMRDDAFKDELRRAWTSEQAAAIIERWELGLPQ